ncbi:MAG: hypothetical protein WCD35_15020, partial [Mycobacteriales bacterium]
PSPTPSPTLSPTPSPTSTAAARTPAASRTTATGTGAVRPAAGQVSAQAATQSSTRLAGGAVALPDERAGLPSLAADRSAVPRPAPAPQQVRISGRHDVIDAPEAARRIAVATTRDPQLPLAVLAVMMLFLLVQSRIDHKDPKLADHEPPQDAELSFGPVAR